MVKLVLAIMYAFCINLYIILRFNMKPPMYLKSLNCHLYQCIIVRFDMKPPWKGPGLAHGSHYFRELSQAFGWIW